MTEVQVLDEHRDAAGGYRVDASRGERIGRVSSEWFSRPDDERYLSLSDLYGAVRRRSDRSRTRTVESAAIRVEANDLVEVSNALTLDGQLHIDALSGFGVGSYTLFQYASPTADNEFLVASGPAGFSYTVDLSTSGEVNLVVSQDVLQFWNGESLRRQNMRSIAFRSR